MRSSSHSLFIHRNSTWLHDWTFIQRVQQSNTAFVTKSHNTPWNSCSETIVSQRLTYQGGSLSGWFPRVLHEAGKELKKTAWFYASAQLKKSNLTLASIVTQPHSLLVCLLSFSPLYSSLLSHAWNLNKANSTARMNPLPDVSKNERRRSQTSHNVPPDDSYGVNRGGIVCFQCFDVKRDKHVIKQVWLQMFRPNTTNTIMCAANTAETINWMID